MIVVFITLLNIIGLINSAPTSYEFSTWIDANRNTVSYQYDGLTSVASKNVVKVKDDNDKTAPVLTLKGITADPFYITKPTAIKGTISDDTAVTWAVTLYDSYNPQSGSGNIAWQHSGTGEVTDTLATLDSMLMVNGAYTLVVKVTDAGGNTTEQVKNIIVDGNMKLYQFRKITYQGRRAKTVLWLRQARLTMIGYFAGLVLGELAFTLQDAQISMPNLKYPKNS